MFEYCRKDLDKFLMSLRKNVMLYEYIDSWDRCNETLLPPKEKLFSKLKSKEMSDRD